MAKLVVAEPRAMKLKELAKKIKDSAEETLTYRDIPFGEPVKKSL